MVKRDVEKGACVIEFRVPKFEQLAFRQKLYSDLETMDYGDAPFDFSVDQWPAWFDKWIERPEKRFYAYLIEKKTGEPVGDINYHFDNETGAYMIGVVILGSKRGQGFAQQGLSLLCQKAKSDGIEKICNLILRNRAAAIHIHEKLGFVEICEKSDKRVVFLQRTL